KEIAEQPRAVADTLLGRLTETGDIVLDEVRLTDQDLRDIDKVFIVACGTAYHAGLVAKYAIEHWTRIPCEVELASEFRYRDPVHRPARGVAGGAGGCAQAQGAGVHARRGVRRRRAQARADRADRGRYPGHLRGTFAGRARRAA